MNKILFLTIFPLSSFVYSQNPTETTYSTFSNVENLGGVSLEIKQLFYKIDFVKKQVNQEDFLNLIEVFNTKFIPQFDEFPNESIFINNDLLYKWLEENNQQSFVYHKIVYDFYTQLEQL